LISFSIQVQTFTFIDTLFLQQDPNPEPDKIRELCLAIADGKVFVQEDLDDDIFVYNASDPFDYVTNFNDNI
jgi:hypothetical protein